MWHTIYMQKLLALALALTAMKRIIAIKVKLLDLQEPDKKKCSF